jgi:hypothetical protein
MTLSVANASGSLLGGMRDFAFGMATSLPANNYWMCMLQLSGATTLGSDRSGIATVNLMVNTSAPVAFQNVMATAGNGSSGYLPYQGQYATTALPAFVGSNAFVINGNNQFQIPYLLANQIV